MRNFFPSVELATMETRLPVPDPCIWVRLHGRGALVTPGRGDRSAGRHVRREHHQDHPTYGVHATRRRLLRALCVRPRTALWQTTTVCVCVLHVPDRHRHRCLGRKLQHPPRGENDPGAGGVRVREHARRHRRGFVLCPRARPARGLFQLLLRQSERHRLVDRGPHHHHVRVEVHVLHLHSFHRPASFTGRVRRDRDELPAKPPVRDRHRRGRRL